MGGKATGEKGTGAKPTIAKTPGAKARRAKAPGVQAIQESGGKCDLLMGERDPNQEPL